MSIAKQQRSRASYNMFSNAGVRQHRYNPLRPLRLRRRLASLASPAAIAEALVWSVQDADCTASFRCVVMRNPCCPHPTLSAAIRWGRELKLDTSSMRHHTLALL